MSTKLYNAYRIPKSEVADIQDLFKAISADMQQWMVENKERNLRLAIGDVLVSKNLPIDVFLKTLEHGMSGEDVNTWDLNYFFERYLIETDKLMTYSVLNLNASVSFSWDYIYWYCVFFVNDPNLNKVVKSHLDPMWDYHYQDSTDPSPTFEGSPHHKEYLEAIERGEEDRWLEKNWYGRKKVWESLLGSGLSCRDLPTYDLCSDSKFGWYNPLYDYGFMKEMKNPKLLEDMVREVYNKLKEKQIKKLNKLMEE